MVPATVSAPQFTEDWFSVASCECLAVLAKQTTDVDGLIVEIGSWEGRSTLALADAVAPAIVHAVDTWLGSPGEPSEQLAAQRDVYAQFLANTVGRNIRAWRMDWRQFFAEVYDDVALRFVFIDAAHTYDEVRAQIETVLPRMSPGGIVCGDDQHYGPIRQAVIECLGPRTPIAASLWFHVV